MSTKLGWFIFFLMQPLYTDRSAEAIVAVEVIS